VKQLENFDDEQRRDIKKKEVVIDINDINDIEQIKSIKKEEVAQNKNRWKTL